MGPSRGLPVLEQISIASPCHARWEEMTGDDRTRHCASCNLQVHNLAGMTRGEAESFIETLRGEGACIRLSRRADGTILTRDCPVGFTAARARVRRGVVRLAAAFGLMTGAAAAGVAASRPESSAPIRLRAFNPFSSFAAWLVPVPPPMPPAVNPRMRPIEMGYYVPPQAPPKLPPLDLIVEPIPDSQ